MDDPDEIDENLFEEEDTEGHNDRFGDDRRNEESNAF